LCFHLRPAYQIEGGWLDGGKGLSVWDAISHTPGKIANGDTGDVADDHYHMFLKDVELMALHGIKHYRLSISWPRILPQGEGDVNPEGQFISTSPSDRSIWFDVHLEYSGRFRAPMRSPGCYLWTCALLGGQGWRSTTS
jgi:hypothetical protein